MGITLWAPQVLAFAGAGILVLVALPIALSETLLFRRWYQSVLLIGSVLLVIGVLLSVAASSLWIVAGIGLIAVIVVIWQAAKTRTRKNLEDEALDFLHGFVAAMGAERGVRETLRYVAQDARFESAYPRMTETVRQIVAEMQAGKLLTDILQAVQETAGASGAVWRQLAILGRVLEESGGRISVDEQRDALEVAWRILYQVREVNESLKQDMASMEMAKWAFTLILPGMNYFLASMIHNYKAVFLESLVGQIVLVFEVIALASILLIFSRLQKLPEVRL